MTDDMESIERHAGKCVGGYMTGAGYRGKTEEQDEAVQEFARRLAEMFPQDVEIRFNTNQMGGGAWLKDGDRDAMVGLGANLIPPEWHQEQFERYLWADGEKPPKPKCLDAEELRLRFTVKLRPPAVEEKKCERASDGRWRLHTKQFQSLEAAWGYFEKTVNDGTVKQYEGAVDSSEVRA